MTHSNPHQSNSKLDLVLERIVDVPRDLVWAAWTVPEHIVKWFTPVPWQTTECQIDLRPGGIFRTVFRSPEGESFSNVGCILDTVTNEKLVWTSALGPGFRPSKSAFPGVPLITAIISLEDHGKGTKYTATVLHETEEDLKKHEEMGFRDGWGTALDQLVAAIKNGNIK
jgi:uncharacterized protein YndB with AHSA1/START domain